MFKRLKNKLRSNADAERTYLGPEEGAYIIGDVHGCFDELTSLLGRIKDHIAQNPPSYIGATEQKKPKIIFLGDLIDRGPRSRDVVEFLKNFNPDYADPIFLKGNHESVLLKVGKGDLESFKFWYEFGGRACMRSYGLTNLGEFNLNPEALLYRFIDILDKSHLEFISSFKHYYLARDYLCVHAGIRPNIPLKDQKNKDFMWIREPFLKHKHPHEYKVVHGHTISEAPENLSNRVGVDTGVYNGYPLSCVFIRNEELTFIQSNQT